MPSKPIIIEDGSDEILTFLKEKLREYNHPFFGSYKRKNFSICIYEDNKDIIAAIYGFYIPEYKFARAEFVWVKEELRRQGLGKALFTKLKEYAISCGCNKLQVSTGDFQGPHFYEKIGFKRIGIAPKWFCDHDEIFMEKYL